MIPNIDQLVQNDLIHRSVYTDPKIFDLEMEYIFNKCWVYVGHAAEIPEPGDYKTTFIGRNPVIVSRLADGGITLLINRCLAEFTLNRWRPVRAAGSTARPASRNEMRRR